MYLNITQPKYVDGFKNNITFINNRISIAANTKIAYICYQDQNLSREPYSAADFSAFASEFSTQKGDKEYGNIVISPGVLSVSKLADQSSGGMVSGLDPNKHYAYKLRSEATYTEVGQGATKIEDLPAGIYDIRCLSDQDADQTEQYFMLTVREKSPYN